MTKSQKQYQLKCLEECILSTTHIKEKSLINYEVVRIMLKQRKQLLDSLFLGTNEEIEQLNRVNNLFIKYEERVQELILDFKLKTELMMKEKHLDCYANDLCVGVALLTRSNLLLDENYPSRFYDMFEVLHDINKKDDGFVHCYDLGIYQPFMSDDPNAFFRFCLSDINGLTVENPEEMFQCHYTPNVHRHSFYHPKLKSITQYSQSLCMLLNALDFSFPDVLGLDAGQLFSQEIEFHSFDANQDDYVPY